MTDQKKNDDEFLDEDFDFDDAETTDDGSFDDFDDAEWEEQATDDKPVAPVKTPKAAKAAKGEKIAPMPGSERSFFARYFYLIIITVVVMLGGGFMFLKMGGAPANAPTTEEAPAETAATDFTGGTENLPAMGEESNDLSLETPDISAEFGDVPPAAVEKLESDMASAIEEAPPMPSPINSMPEDLEITKPDEPEVKPEAPAQEKAGIETEALTPMFEPETAPAAPEQEIEIASTPEMAAPESAPIVMSEQTKASLAQQDKKIEQLESQIDQLERKLGDRLDSADSKMSDISTTLAALNTKIDALGSRPAPVVERAPAVSAAPAATAPATKPAIKSLIPAEPETVAPARTSTTPAATATPSRSSVSWELRFAQPGKAMLAEKGASDFRTVEVGDTLPGLGKITLIDQVGGRWIVRGTQGTVSQ